MQTVKVQNTTLVRDIHSKAILQTNVNEYIQHKKRRNFMEKVDRLERIMKKMEELNNAVST